MRYSKFITIKYKGNFDHIKPTAWIEGLHRSLNDFITDELRSYAEEDTLEEALRDLITTGSTVFGDYKLEIDLADSETVQVLSEELAHEIRVREEREVEDEA